MQAKDIVIGETYAIRRREGWVAFHPTSVVTSRTGNGPGKTSTRVEGWVEIPGKDEREQVKVQVTDIDDTFAARKAIIEQQAADEARRKAEEEKLERLRARLANVMRKLGIKIKTGYERNPDPDRLTRQIEIEDESLPELARLLGVK